ncbi:10739_t:CDS:2 [Entrophospora sp. SA101]|nr:10739_t:CDS:2 [Entrophospora sp. SA101]
MPSLRVETFPELYDISNWKVKSEGNANIILSFVGKKDKFMLLEVPTEFLKDLSKAIFSSRSYKRTHKDIDLNQRYVILTLDVTTFISKTITPILSVELKFQSCRFCMHKWLKFHEQLERFEKEKEAGGSSNSSGGDLSGYCPLDLFSLDEKRLRKAISELLICPKNNLKLFIEGVNVPIENNGSQEHLKRFFNINSSTNNNKDDEQKVKDLFIELLSNAISKERVLFERIKLLQKSLDEFDIEGLYQFYLEHQTNLEPTLEEWNDIVRVYVNRSKKTELSVPSSIVDFTVEEVRQRIYEFLISTTFKDCSIIFTFRKSSNDNDSDDFVVEDKRIKKVSILVDNNDNGNRISSDESAFGNTYKNNQQQHQECYYDFKVHVIDLDPKSIKTIPYYHQLDNKIFVIHFI